MLSLQLCVPCCAHAFWLSLHLHLLVHHTTSCGAAATSRFLRARNVHLHVGIARQ
jgi:hypothetical protein